MKILSFFLALRLLALSGTAVAATEEEAMDLIYAWLRYDMDALVWGVGKGYVASGCVGKTLEHRRCTFNEFVNFIVFGKAAEEPSYYDGSSELELTISTFGNLVDAGKKLAEPLPDHVYDRYAGGSLKSAAHLSRFLGNTLKETRAQAVAKGVNIAHELGNLKIAIDLMATHGRASLHTNLAKSIPSAAGIVFELFNKNDMFKGSWTEFDWAKTASKYPQLRDPTSALSKKVRTALNDHFKVPANARVRTRFQHMTDVKRLCL